MNGAEIVVREGTAYPETAARFRQFLRDGGVFGVDLDGNKHVVCLSGYGRTATGAGTTFVEAFDNALDTLHKKKEG